ncbi:deaminase [Inquilinus sp. KBS0705]|nr:deaminase [Inquilinus sp. KBS0705]
MRTVTYGMNISIDGNYDHTKFNGDREIHEYFTALMEDVDQIVYGRKMYELMFPYWADVAREGTESADTLAFAKRITEIDKIVFSKTLTSVEGNAVIMRDNPGEVIRKLKEQPGKRISIGGVNLREQLTVLGLVDEFYFVIHPAIVGKGRKLFDNFDIPEKINLTLANSKVLKNGCIALHYVKEEV